MAFAPIKNGQLYYRLDGQPDSPVLLLSNSLGSDHTMWDAQMPLFERHFRVLRYDSRGHGSSTASDGDYTIEMLGNDVLALMDHLELSAVNYCGLSLGGILGQWLALHAPGRLTKLVLCNTAAYIGPPANWNARIAAVNEGGMGAISQTILQRWLTAGFREAHPDIADRIRAMMEATPPLGYVAACAAIRDSDFRSDLPRITARPLVIAGTHDGSTPLGDGRFLAEQIPGSQFLELNAAHFSNVELPELFTQSVLKFLL